MKDYYKILGIAATATPEEIKAVYRKLAKRYHPDVVKGDAGKEAKMYEIQEAYQCLGDAKKRKAYDEARMNPQRDARTGTNGKVKRSGNMDRETAASDMSQFERFFGFQPGQGMETYQGKKETARKPDGPIKPEEMFASFFNKTGNRTQKGK